MSGRPQKISKYEALSVALVTEITAAMAEADDPMVIERRLLPRRDRTEFESENVYLSIYARGHTMEVAARQADREEWTLALAIQQLAETPTATPGDNAFARVTESAADPLDWGDSFFAVVKQIKDLYRAESDSEPAGTLRDQVLAGCQWMRLENAPLYLPVDLAENGILTSLISLTYMVLDP